MKIETTTTLVEEFRHRASQLNLDVQCPGAGTFNAEIAIVGEAPGDGEVHRKTPMIGHSGTLLWNVLKQNKIDRHATFVTNLSKRQIAFGKKDKENVGKQPLSHREFEQWKDLLLWELSQLPNLKYVVAAGNYALQALTGKEGITSWRGSVLTASLPGGREVKVICTFNPAMCLREPKTEIAFNLDLHKLRRVIDGKHNPKPVETFINPSYDDALAYLRELRTESQKHGTPVAFDIEVISNETACVGFANNATTAMCLNWRTLADQRYTVVEERTLRREVQALLADPAVRLIAQNGMFDTYWMWYKDLIRVPRVWFDTMLAHHTLYPSLPHNLGYLTTQYTDHPFYKDEKDEWREGGNIDDFWTYNGKDCCHTWEVHVRELAELKRAGLDQFFFSHVMRLQPHLARMTVGGVKLDMSLKEQIKEQLYEDVAKKLSAFHSAVQEATGLTDYSPNPGSHTQLSELFFRRLKLVGRGASTDAANRKRMLAHPKTSDASKNVIIRLDDWAKDNKFATTYAGMEVDPDGRARCEYKQTGVQSAPGRLSSAKVLWGSGMNLQNQPPRAQPMFVADEGFSFGYFDMAQAEARIVAWNYRIETWIEQFERARIQGGYDAHRALASEMWGIPYDEVPTEDSIKHDDGTYTHTLRFIAKRCRHGLNYRMGPERLAETTGLTPRGAMEAYNLYHRATPELKRGWHRDEKQVRDTKMLFNAFGRRLIMLERLTPEALESIVAFYPQSTLGDHVCRVIYQCESDDRWPAHARMVLNIHDALICLAPHDKVKTCLSIMKAYAEQPIMVRGEPLIIPADCKISVPDDKGIERWSTLKKASIEAARLAA